MLQAQSRTTHCVTLETGSPVDTHCTFEIWVLAKSIGYGVNPKFKMAATSRQISSNMNQEETQFKWHN